MVELFRNSTLTSKVTWSSTWSITPSGSTMPSSLTRPLWSPMTHSIWSMTPWRNRSTDPLWSSLGTNVSSPPPPHKQSMAVPSRPLRSWRTAVCVKSAKSSPCTSSSVVLIRLSWTSCNTYDTANLNSTYWITSSARCSCSISRMWRTTKRRQTLRSWPSLALLRPGWITSSSVGCFKRKHHCPQSY